MDSVRVKGRSFLILADSSIYIEKDTVIFLPDSVARQLRRDETRRSDEFYKRLKERFYKTRFTRELYDLLFVDPSKSAKPKETTSISNGNYKKYEGRRINRIIIKKLEVFGTSILDTTRHSKAWAAKVANDLHVYTRSRIIRNNIFFAEGDNINPDALSDSERVLRNLPYVRDARIYVISGSDSEDVEVLIIIKDIWSISGEVSVGGFDAADFAVIDKNFLGLGHELRNEFLYNTDHRPAIGYNGTYSINNIKNTFITGEVNFARSEPLDRVGIRFYRNFITPEIKYAGGVELNKTNILLKREYPDTTISFHTEFNHQDMWVGRSWLIDANEDKGRTNLQLAARYDRVRYLDRPVVTSDTNQMFFDRNLYLYSFGISRRDYEKSSLVRGYGRTEDIPNGYLLEFTTGKESNEFYNRAYIGWRFSIGNFYGRTGYFRPSMALGGFIRKGRVEQGTFKTTIDYFSHLYRFRRVNFRQFFRLDYTIGINRFHDEFVNINNGRGIRGLSDTFLRGTRKIALSAETVAFTPIYVIGFRFAFFGFIDLAMVNSENSKLLKNPLYQGYGIGLRLRNENMAFEAIQIRLAWYPVTPPDQSSLGFELTGQEPLRIPDFRIERPDVLEFN
ncbi:hypothetical protein C900_05250 [Fulvivirga imtechensis AK7]|uniref:Uncharacterized protein n=1 Tax=Fulvivirga imtechensis AK7 TaxID=1237149 RepID=L8JVX7_9BACT|nr:hypothetical protein [Fulvivirga imtechensis]ELR73201.1 hypothetical protein C900_05250 [Fulvivirga imtechensis AK7]